MQLRFLLIFIAFLAFHACTGKLSTVTNRVYDEDTYRQFWSADWSPDGRLIAVGGVDSTLRIYHAADLRLHKSFAIEDYIHVVKWNVDGHKIAIATLTDYVQLLDVETSKLIKLDNSLGPSHPANGNGSRAIDWNYTGEMLAVGGLDGIIKVWDKQGRLISYVEKYPPETSFLVYLALDWHPTENLFVAANFEIQMYDSSGKELEVMQHVNPEAIVLCADWHPSGDFFVIGDYGHDWEGENVPSLLHFWSRNGELIKSVTGSRGEYRSIKWNHSGELLATASDVLRLWTQEGVLLREGIPDGSNYLWGISWNPKGNRVVTSSRHETIALWDSKARLMERIDVVN